MVANFTNSAVGVVETGLVLGHFFAPDLGVTLKAGRAAADGTMVPRLAFGVDAAHVRKVADILALPVDTGLLVGAVVVVTTAL